ncbi:MULTISPECIES: DUF1127 domain-containing protein [unclassified Hahella]|uniref:DUF1127 domain-containing protein n=1 Tax=unclassified Hahella TaxID=2624107 RepID=UPI001C1EDD93|nr:MULTISPECIES: DUF1127 domain-containing protein [unclassified Hahella]MBU6952840.1 DUF1127 domain-containing protein [Hahella sp. HN01]MDG9670205.1 DUF1127 domain-containing protein [Hahella sp. CR1]
MKTAIRLAQNAQQAESLDFLTRLKNLTQRWIKQARTRRELANLNDHLLRDLGITEEDRRQETSKPFWRN